MKHYQYIFIFLISFFNLKAQTNLVINPSFEQYSTCPTIEGQMQATGCSTYREISDYYNTCATIASRANVPYAFTGAYQYAACGNAYIGVYVYYPANQGVDDREAAGCQLTTSLTIGTKYYVSFKASLAGIDSTEWLNTATDHLGVLFTVVPYTIGSPSPVNNFAHVYSHTIITDTLNWTQVFGSFVADSAYKYIVIGNFFDDAHINKMFFSAAHDSAAYYFVDEVCVSTDSAYTATWNCAMVGIQKYNNNQQQINLYPNPSYNGVFYTDIDFINETIEVFDVLGKSLYKQQINGNIINLSYLDNGMYIIQFNNQYQSKQKIIINK